MKVSIVSPLDARSSYGLHAIQIARRLPRHGIEVVLRPSRQIGELPDDIKALVQHGANDANVELILHIPTLAPERGRKTLYYSMAESTRLKPEAVAILNKADVVAVPSDWCATVFSSNGVSRPIVTVPLGCDEAFIQQPVPKTTPFTFACAGNLANGPKRKGIERVMQLFRKAFPDEDVRLRVKLNGSRDEQSWDKRITFDTEFRTNEQLAEWLSEAHCFVNLATGGFELWPLQAMRCGTPVIGFTYGGMGQFLNHNNGLVVDHRLVPAQDSWQGLGVWAEADEGAVIQAMRYAVANPQHCARLGETAMHSVKEFTFGKHVERLAQLLKSMWKKHPTTVKEPSRGRKDLIKVVFPVCAADVDLAIAHAEWLATLPMRTEHTAMVATDAECPAEKLKQLKDTLAGYFHQVDEFIFANPPTKGWPQAANWAFQQTALYMARGTNPWLWLEPDAVVLSEDWLEKIQAEYDRGGKAFMGAVVKQMGHMNGVGVYPPDTPVQAPHAMSCTDIAFDYAIKDDIEKKRHDASALIQHIWSVQGDTASENQEGPAPVNVSEEQARRWLTRDAVLVHRVKDASLVNLLKSGFRRTRVEVVVTHWRRPGNIPIVRDAIRGGTERVMLTLIDACDMKENACTTEGFDRVFRVPNLGSWNRMVVAGGYDCDYTLFIDDDVLPSPSMVETFLNFAKEVGDNFSVLGFKGRGFWENRVQIIDDPMTSPIKVEWLARVYFIKTRDLHYGLGERHRIGSRLKLPTIHIDAVICKGIARATGQPCYALPPLADMSWDALPENDAVWQKGNYHQSLTRTIDRLNA